MGEAERLCSAPILADLQSVIDAIPDNVSIIASNGTIQYVNKAWREFSWANGGDRASFYVGANYLQLCHESSGEGFELAEQVAEGLARVLSEGESFTAEYPCHSPTERRWFIVFAEPLEVDGARCAMVMHRNVSEEKRHELDATAAERNARNLAAIVETMPDAVIGMDLKGRITSWNNAAQKLYGYSADDTIGRSVEILFPPDWEKSVETYISELVSQEKTQFEVARQTKFGQRRTIEITAAPIRSLSGEIIGVSNVNRDVTDKRRAEQRLRNILNNLFSFVGILELDGTLTEANRAPLEAAGLEPGDVIGKKFWDCHWWSHSPDVQQRLKDACEKAKTGEVVRYDEEIRVAGEQLIWIDFQLAPLFNEDGEVENLIPSGIDITDRRAAHEALHNSHETFSGLVRRSPFGIYTVDADFRLAHVSDGAQEVFSNVRPLIGRDFAEILRILWPEPFATEAIGHFRHTLETGEPYRSPSTIEHRSDIDVVESYDWKIERITMPDGRQGVVCHFYDLSERQRHEEHIRFLMHEVNHRAKNLLTVVSSMARQTARGSSPTEFAERFSARLLGLAASQDLIVQGNWSGVTVKDLIQSQLRHLAQEGLPKRVRIAGPDLMLTPAAAQGIGMALHEMSTNSIKYGALSVPDGTVSIEWSADEGDETFCMQWTEQNGPPVSPPKKFGFGRTVIEKMAAISVGGDVGLEYARSGVAWTLRAPISRIISTTDKDLP